MANAWQQHQVWDGTYIYDDLLDWHEMQVVKGENEKRLREFYKTQSELENGNNY
jgi:hypothetical protein